MTLRPIIRSQAHIARRVPHAAQTGGHRLVPLLLVLLAAAGCDPSPRRPLEQATRNIQRQRLDRIGRTLSSDALGGRHFATAEADSAAAVLLRELQEQGIERVDLAANVFGTAPRAFAHVFGTTLFRLSPRNKLAVQSATTQASLQLGRDYLPLLHSRNEEVTGRLSVVMQAEALESPRLDVRDRVVLVGPAAVRPQEGEAIETTLHRVARRLELRGARAVAFAGLDAWASLRTVRYASQLPREEIELARSPRGQRLNLHLDRLVLQAQAEAWRLAPTHTIPALVLGPGAWRAWTSDSEVGIQVDLVQEVALGQNILVGFGGRRADSDVVLLVAHLDHAGVNAAGDILNGADDNATGVAALLGVTRALSRVTDRLQQGVLVAFVSGELLGRQGTETLLRDFSTLFGERRIRCAFVLDAVGRNGRDRIQIRTSTASIAQRRALETHNHRSSLLAPALLLEPRSTAVVSPSRHDVRQHESSHDLLESVGIPSVLFNDGLDPYLYGQPEDDWKRVDAHKVTRVARLVFRVAADLALQPPERTLPASQP